MVRKTLKIPRKGIQLSYSYTCQIAAYTQSDSMYLLTNWLRLMGTMPLNILKCVPIVLVVHSAVLLQMPALAVDSA